MININFESIPYYYIMSLELDYSETPHSTTTNQLIIENNQVYQQITYTRDIMSTRQLEHLIDTIVTNEGFIPEILGNSIVFTNNSNEEKYVIDKEKMIIVKEKNVLIGPLEDV